ncbi:type II secretion system secretin GspD [Lichenihabitans sp. Uapishka_5]|uniref:type II secretion system secretin GspD n=1 Tax=Lichenihabitans sp. Uapishka_5 TaxID=3037302 RepID=UPI0029E7DF3B|nr:type II secretion system secretin GspD [Lichenihabitans sp. Uapishka_5]MDX7952699.1 type II secretion system secretin GspD [Lichenihabitans sp. Uapishka_5]
MALWGTVRPVSRHGRAQRTRGSVARGLALLLALQASACVTESGNHSIYSSLDGLSDPLHATRDLATPPTGSIRPPRAASDAARRGVVSVGDDLFVSEPLPGGRLYAADGQQDVTLNLVDTDIAVAAKTVITDILGQSLIVDDKVSGTVTLQTVRPVSRAVLVDLFESVLAAKGYTLIRAKDAYRIVDGGHGGPGGGGGGTGGYGGGGLPIGVGGRDLGPGLSAQVIPLRYISAEDMRNLLASVAPKEAVVSADAARNFIIVSGTRAQVTAILETVSLFDVDWMRGMSAAIFPLKSSNPAATAEELEQLFGSAGGPLRGTIKFIPNTHLNAVLVITSRAEYLRRARELIHRLEDMAVQSENQLFVYKVQNRPAKELAEIVRGMLSSGGGGSSGSSGLAPKLGAASSKTSTGFGFDKTAGSDTGTGAGDKADAAGADPMAPGAGAAGSGASDKGAGASSLLASSRATAASDLGATASGGGSGSPMGLANVTVTSDESNNSLVISGTRRQYDKVLAILTSLDAPPIQVLLEATIAEVTLNDELKFGVRWYLTQHHYGLAETDDSTGAVASAATAVTTGMSFTTTLGEIRTLLNTLSAVTNVKIVSTPSLTVLDNHAANLQVGDEVPIIKSSTTNTSSSTGATTTDVEYKSTGVILSVTPRVNQNGLVLLDINQEVSGVTSTTTSAIDSPTIQQRKVSTSVIVQDGQTLALGGLVQDKRVDNRTRMPLLGNLPAVGALFGTTDNSKVRTELIVFVRPRVLRNTVEARQVTDEFRGQLSELFRAQKRNAWKDKMSDDLSRMEH